jgi:glycosyltransferase involved in cell wall biosynthesis
MTTALIIIGAFITLGYIVLIYTFANGLRKSGNGRCNTESILTDAKQSLPFVSVIIAARNEENYIEECLKSLANQSYPASHFEIIVVDDHSEDMTFEIINRFNAETGLPIVLLKNDSDGKKAAIKKGIFASHGEYLLFTDADCRVSPDWILSITECFVYQQPVFITGPVMLSSSEGYFNAFQCLEFSSLIASTAGSIAVNKPIMANGANMAYSKLHYLKMLGERDDIMGEKFDSGDDVFTMFSMKQFFGPEKISFLNSMKGVVYTSAKENLKELLEQRLRWVSKSKGYKDKDVILTAILVFGCNLMIVLLLFAGLLDIGLFLTGSTSLKIFSIIAFTVLLTFKATVDYYLLSTFLKKFNKTELLRVYAISIVPVMLFTVVTAIMGNFVKVFWKKRRVS